MNEQRVDPSMLTDEERAQLPQLLEIAAKSRQPRLTSTNGEEARLPEAIAAVLVKVIAGVRDGQAFTLISEKGARTTMAAAKHLGMSRQHFVGLLESGKIPFYRVGKHRRVAIEDLREFVRKRDGQKSAKQNRVSKKGKGPALKPMTYEDLIKRAQKAWGV